MIAFGDTKENKYEIKTIGSQPAKKAPRTSPAEILLIAGGSGYANLAGVLCAGFYLHQFSVPIVKSSANPEKVTRDIWISYFMVYMSFMVVGVFGYFGFNAY